MIFSPVFYGTGNGIPVFTFDGSYKLNDEGNGNWNIEFLSSGTFISSRTLIIDVFVVGAGGGGRLGGGGGGYVRTVKSITLKANTVYNVIVGDGVAGERGGQTIAFNVTAEGGNPGGDDGTGGNGASGGGGWSNGNVAGNGGSNGSDGENGSSAIGGVGQHGSNNEYNTCAFGVEDGRPYGPGGGGGNYGGAGTAGNGGEVGGGDGGFEDAGEDGTANTGGGGGGSNNSSSPTKGGSGIAIIRNHRKDEAA